MASLAFFAEALESDPVLVASVRFMMQLHVDEGHIPPRPLAGSGNVHHPPKPQSHQEPTAASPPLATGSPAAHAEVYCAPIPEREPQPRPAAVQPPRRMGGAVPSTPYTPLSMRKHRRPHSASVRSSTATDTMLPLGAQRQDSQTFGSSGASQTSTLTDREHRKGEFVDRWLEKLYFRNPVIVTQKRSGSTTSFSAPSPTCSAAPAIPSPAEESADGSNSDPRDCEVVHIMHVREDEEIVAQLPPKPQSLQNSTKVRQDILIERLTQCFSAMQPPQKSLQSGPTRPLSRPQSPMTRNATVTASSLSASSVALPSVSRFVEKKRAFIG